MPSLKIIINPYTGENSFYKNQSRIGSKSRSPFRNLTSSSIFGWIYKLPSLAESEMNDKYDMVVSAPEFETAIIRLVMKGQALCSSFREEPFEVHQSVADRLVVATKLREKYTQWNQDSAQEESIAEEVDGGIVHIKLGKIQLDVIEDAEESIDFTNNGIVWHTLDKQGVSRMIYSRFCDVPLLLSISNSLIEYRGQMSDSDRDAYDSLLLTEPCIVPSVESEIEVGKSSAIGIKLIPEGAKCPELKVTTDNPIFAISGLSITASDVGKGTISISKANEPDDILTFAVKSFRHNSVTMVRLSAKSNIMECGSQQQINVTMEPVDAEDADKLSIVSGTPEVLRVVNDSIVDALKPGAGVVIASCGNCSSELQINVLPKLESVKLDIEDNKEFRVGESINAKLVLTPSGAFPYKVDIESSDSSVLAVEHYLDGEYRIKARCIGNCEVVIKDEDGTVINRQPAHVISTLYKKKKPSYTAFIGLAFLLACIFIPLRFFNVPDFVFIILLIGALLLSLWSIFKEKRHYLTSILVAVAIILLLGYASIAKIRENNQKTETQEIQQTIIDNGNRNQK